MGDYEVGELNRQMANLIRVGRIAELDSENARVRVAVAGLNTDWLPWSVVRAGKTRHWSPPQVDEQVIIASPYGDMGQAVVMGSLYQDDSPAPSTSKDQETTTYPDGASVDHNSDTHVTTVSLNAAGTLNASVGASTISMDTGRILLSSNGCTLEVSAAGVIVNGVALTHNGKNVGDTHTHGGVMAGPASTSVPN